MRYRSPAVAVLLACAFTLRAEQKFYQITLIPSGTIIASDLPVTKGNMVVFHGYPSGTLVSMPRSSVKSVSPIASGSARDSNAAASVIPIGNLAMQGGATQAGPQNARAAGQAKAAAAGAAAAPKENQIGGPGFYSDIVPGQTQAFGNSPNDYQVGRTYAYAPSNATQSSPGSPPTAPAMTNGQNPPQ
ncbi:MAG TPA: hypothetical protein VMH79_00105 [Thermoanaerobaculia bacterium]|nr:hypothetical protein [Thermoanaerobaculia bacterium]